MKKGLFYKKILASAIIVSMMSSGLFSNLTAERVYAVSVDNYVPVKQPPVLEKYVGVTIFGHVIPHTSLNAIYILMMRTLLAHMTDSIVNWINNGFEGGPSFVTDPKKFLLGVGDEIAGEFINGTEWGWVCDPFRLNIRIALSLGLRSFARQRKCTLTGILKNFDNFFTGTFKEGGWQSWFEITTNPSANAFTSFLIVDAELQKRIKEGKDMEIEKLRWGKGFLSSQECLAYDKDTRECVKWGPIRTPGTIIESQLVNVLNESYGLMGIADDIDKIVGALMAQLVRTVLQRGLTSLNSDDGWSGTSGDFEDLDSKKEITGWCAADRTDIYIGDTVEWTASVYDGTTNKNALYIWEGDEIRKGTKHDDVGDIDTLKVTYKRPGTKKATVTVTKNNKTIKLNCENSVAVSIKNDTCFVDKDYASLNDKVLWTVMTLDGAPATYEWKSSDPSGPFGTTKNVEVAYNTPGIKAAMVNIAKENRATTTVVCSNKVAISASKLMASCIVDPNSGNKNIKQNDGTLFTWTAIAKGGTGEYSYSWAGSDNLNGSSATTTARYSKEGSKSGQITVDDGNETVTANCKEKATVH